MKTVCALVLMLTAFCAMPAIANDADTPIVDLTETEIADRSKSISKGLRCVVCQNQSIADSNSPLAEDMRNLVEKRVRLGDSETEVRSYMQERYGDFILMTPPFKPYTALLWFGPFLILSAGGYWFWRTLKSRSEAPETVDTLTEEETAHLNDILKDNPR